MLHSTNQRLAMLADLSAHVFYGYRAFIDWATEAFADMEMPPDIRVVIADKGFIDRSKTVFSINRQWGRLGRFVVNPRPYPMGDLLREPVDREGVLELGQDVEDFSYRADRAGYDAWLEQWPDRRFRPHPKVERSQTSLGDDLAEVGRVVGLNTSALVAASMAGLRVDAFGAHSMARGIDSCRLERLSWLRSIEFDRRDPTQVEAISAALGDPERASVCPEGESQTQASPQGSRKKPAKKRRGLLARGKSGDQSGADSDESVET